MSTPDWLLPPILAAAGGALCAQYLTVHPLQMGRALTAVLVTGFAWLTLTGSFRGPSLPAALGLSALAALAGYAGMAHIILSRTDDRPLPSLQRQPGDPGLGHIAVIYFAHGEPETYDPIGWINQFREFDRLGTPFVPFLARPFFLSALRRKYLEVGKSGHRWMHQRMLASLEQSFRTRGDEQTRFYICFLDDSPRPDAAVIQALNEGASAIIVAEVFVTNSNHTAEGKELIDALHVERLGVALAFTRPLWDSPTLHRMFVRRVNANLKGTPKEQVGVLLVGHGQPAEWDELWPTETAHETSFRLEILKLFEQDGYDRRNLGLAWMEFRPPRPAAKAEELVRNGATRIFYFPAAISADAIHSQHDVPALLSQARLPDGVSMVNLGAWNDDPLAIQAIAERVIQQIALLRPQRPPAPSTGPARG